ncbi:unnamed protein product, partial [Thelazia callipaeda]|uniref:tRNA-binding domain-containing protein n=1 Tax=Thelazia callipaeda TaxID=103827 RepID=A0A0N5CNF8_THECL
KQVSNIPKFEKKNSNNKDDDNAPQVIETLNSKPRKGKEINAQKEGEKKKDKIQKRESNLDGGNFYPFCNCTNAGAKMDDTVDIGRLDIRVGRIVKVEKHPDADSLYVEQIDVGEEKYRSVISGLVKHIPIEQMQDRFVICICNLKPVKMRGIESQGMVLCASTPEKVELIESDASCTPGQIVTCEGYIRRPDPVLNPKKKIWEAIAPDLKVNDSGQVVYKGQHLLIDSRVSLLAPTLRNVPVNYRDCSMVSRRLKSNKIRSLNKKNVPDDRFEVVLSDPRFDALPRRERKVVIDERFKDVLKSEKFSAKSKVDMRGRCVDFKPKNTLNDLYELASSGDSSSAEVDEDEKIKIDLARGTGNVTSSDEDSSDWELEEVSQNEEHNWGEPDKDANRVQWASNRLALCNMEWDRISATDIYVLMSSFKPPAPATIRSVTIYVSSFGQKRLEEEERSGPRLTKLKKTVEDIDDIDEETRESMRAYQLERMKYYYAVIECDEVKTASCIYEACDGVEFESSAIRLDLRFVPDDMTFEENVIREQITEDDINFNTFKPKNFESAALSKSSAKLTWDETDPERIKATRDAFLPDADLSQLQHLLAPCSSDEEDEVGKTSLLLKETEDKDNKSDSVMEVTWNVETTEDANSSKRIKNSAEQTPWQKYLEKRRSKRKERKAVIAELKKKQKEEMADVTEKSNNVSLVKVKHRNEPINESDYIDDERFKALYSSSAFAIDQSHPLFKSSKMALRQVSFRIFEFIEKHNC